MKKISRFLSFAVCSVIAVCETSTLPKMAIVQVIDRYSISMGARSTGPTHEKKA